MSTVTVRPVSPEMIATQKQAAALAELKRNGIDAQYQLPPVAPLPAKTRNFVSREDAIEMQAEDVANVEPLTPTMLERIRESQPRLYHDLMELTDGLWDLWPEGDERWELTPHQARKVTRRKAL